MIKYIRTVDSKALITDKNNNTIRDLSAQSLKDTDFRYIDLYICSEDFRMRPELIAQLKMGDSNKLEILLKANDISNPFTVDAGDTFIIPDPISSPNKFTATVVTDDPRTKIRKQYLDPKKTSIKNTGDNYQDYIEREKTMLPPNYAKTGDKEIIVANGKIILGPHITRSVDKSKDVPLSMEKFIEKLKGLKNG